MTYKLDAHLEGDVIVLDVPPPVDIRSAKVSVLVEMAPPAPTPEERTQSLSGFAKNVLLSPEEDVWEND